MGLDRGLVDREPDSLGVKQCVEVPAGDVALGVRNREEELGLRVDSTPEEGDAVLVVSVEDPIPSPTCTVPRGGGGGGGGG